MGLQSSAYSRVCRFTGGPPGVRLAGFAANPSRALWRLLAVCLRKLRRVKMQGRRLSGSSRPACFQPCVYGILHGVPKICLLVVPVLLKCSTVAVGVHVIVQLGKAANRIRDGSFFDIAHHFSLCALDG